MRSSNVVPDVYIDLFSRSWQYNLYSLSFLWIMPVVAAIVTFVAILTSLAFGGKLLFVWWPFLGLMMTSSNGNIFRVTGPLCGEFTGHRWIPLTKASDAELCCFLWSAPERFSKQSRRRWFETPLRPLWRQHDAAILEPYLVAKSLILFMSILSSNYLLCLKIGHQDSSPNNGRQGDIPHWFRIITCVHKPTEQMFLEMQVLNDCCNF